MSVYELHVHAHTEGEIKRDRDGNRDESREVRGGVGALVHCCSIIVAVCCSLLQYVAVCCCAWEARRHRGSSPAAAPRHPLDFAS